MKHAVLAAAIALGATLATACYAQAEPAPVYAGPPGGYMAGPPAGYVAPVPGEAPPVAQVDVRADVRADVTTAPPRAPGVLRAAVIARFDRNGDGRLDVRERRQALRALRRLTRQLAREERRARRAERVQRQAPPPMQPRANVDVEY